MGIEHKILLIYNELTNLHFRPQRFYMLSLNFQGFINETFGVFPLMRMP